MTITFLDPRDQSLLICSSAQIDQFLADWSTAISQSRIQWDRTGVHNLIKHTKDSNAKNATLEYLYINIHSAYVADTVELAESYGIPILVRLSEIYQEIYDEMTILLKNKKCLKYLVLGPRPRAEYHYVTDDFIKTLLTTDIYGLSLYFITPQVNKFFRLIESNKLIKIELAKDEDLARLTTASVTFYELLTALSNTPQSILKQLIVSGIEICHPNADDENAAYLATLIQENVNLTEIDLNGCYLTVNFLTLLAQKLLQTVNISDQPLKLNLGSNRDVARIMDKFSQCLAANVNISDLNLYNTGLTNIGAGFIGLALEQNTVLAKLSLQSCPITNVKIISRAILNNSATSMVSLDLMMIERFDLEDARSLAKLIRSNKIKELNIYQSFHPDLEEEEKANIYKVLLDAYAENSSITTSDLVFSGVSLRQGEIYDKIKYVLSTRTVPIKFEHLGNKELKDLMQLQIDNQAISSKTLIQILLEYQK